MKKLTCFSLALFIVLRSFGQQTTLKKTETSQEYLQKSESQKKAARIWLGTGAALITTGIIIGT